MLVRSPKGWEIAEALATPEDVYLDRRAFMAGGAATAALTALPAPLHAAKRTIPTADLYPARRNDTYKVTREITHEAVSSRYNNFIEFGPFKFVWQHIREFEPRPWDITIDGAVEAPLKIDVDDLIRKIGIEERLYRHRCVEAWAMTVPWSGFELSKLIAMAKPLQKAKFVRMESFRDPKVAKYQRFDSYPWPYSEVLTIEEAANELAFLVTGAYGKPLVKQFGAPLRLAVPWKYGFKSIKSIRRISFLETRPKTFWEEIQGEEYGFWANVNPEVPHKRWEQNEEQLLGSGRRVPTRLFNGYAEFVAHLYKGLESENLYM